LWGTIRPAEGLDVPKGAIHPQTRRRAGAVQGFSNELTEAHILPFIPEAAKIDQKKDKDLALRKDSSDNASVHAVATGVDGKRTMGFHRVYYDGHRPLLPMPHAYHPPKLEWIKEDDFASTRMW